MNKLFLILSASGLLFLTSCNSNSASIDQQYCTTTQLLLEQSDYPSETIFDEINSPIAEEPLESASRSVYYRENWIGEIVIRYPSIDRAHEVFAKRQESIFNPKEVDGLWETPSELRLENISADQYEIACGNVRNFGDRCIMIGQYKEYIVLFNVDVSNNDMTHEMIRDLALKIDSRVSACVDQ